MLLALTLAPTPSSVESLSQYDKWVHAGLFGGLAFLLYWNVDAAGGLRWVVALGVALAAFIEGVQVWLPYRSGDLWDLLAGAAGVLIGTIGALFALGRGSLIPARSAPPNSEPQS